MVYCPQSIMESISPSRSADRHQQQQLLEVIVSFPSLPPSNPPTDDSEGGEAAIAADAAAGSSSASSSSSSGASSTATRRRKARCDSPPPSTAATSSSSTYSNKSHQQPPPVPNLIGTSDPAAEMKIYLNELVAFIKSRKKEKEDMMTYDHVDGDGRSNTSEEGGEGGERSKRRKLECNDDDDDKKQAATTTCEPDNKASSSSSSSYKEEMELLPKEEEPIETIMHWMDSFQEDEMIQLMCLQSLPAILENPNFRRIAQSDGLASIVLYDMAAFPSNSLLILTAFHTLVVLLRPLGTNEGMVHKASSVTMIQRSTMSCTSSKGIRSINARSTTSTPTIERGGGGGGVVASPLSSRTTAATEAINSINFIGNHYNHSQHHHQSSRRTSTTSTSSSVISNAQLYDSSMNTNWEDNGVRVMLDSLRRFSNDRYLQAMGCWALVNAALYPSLKSSLTRLGGVYAVTNAMMLHPNAEAVQFRGLFALINLVIPERDSNSNNERSRGCSIHSHVYQIARLTILAMKNFHTNKSILNRGCLVLRNLSLTPSFVKILGRTPGCVDMLLHCRQICPRDVLVQRSARTIMVMIQRATEKEQLKSAHDCHTFTLTKPFPALLRESSIAARSSSSTSTIHSECQQKGWTS